jgi:Endosomal/lysosomal potassium channel TMEM175
VEVHLNTVGRLMGKGGLEAFSDGVLAIIITIMVLEMKVPHGENLEALLPVLPVFLSDVLSFVYLGIYWNNHHHLLHACQKVSGSMLWANLHLLFWLSLIPFVTGWMGANHFAAAPPPSTVWYCSWQRSPTGSCSGQSWEPRAPTRCCTPQWAGISREKFRLCFTLLPIFQRFCLNGSTEGSMCWSR